MAWFYFWRNPNFLLAVDDESSAVQGSGEFLRSGQR
jgi:hypothetical protein